MLKTVKDFLKFLKKTGITELFGNDPVRVACGNSSADFDSVACAITYAFCSYHNDPRHPIIPIISIPRADLCLRRDIVKELGTMDITEDMLFFMEDIKQFKNQCKSLTAVLVDHNVLECTLKPYIDEVTGIIDHHKDERLYEQACPREIMTTGSCSSLVFNYWNVQLQNLEVLKEVANLALGAGLIDTSNFKYKVEQPDLDALKLYSKLLPDVNREQYYTRIRKDKDDLDGLNIKDILRKDYKQFSFQTSSARRVQIGIASVVKPLEWFYEQFGGVKAFKQACKSSTKEHNVDVFVVMTAWAQNGDFKRELTITSDSIPDEAFAQIIKYLEEKLQLELITQVTDESKFPIFKQKDVSASRKQVAPFLKDAVQLI